MRTTNNWRATATKPRTAFPGVRPGQAFKDAKPASQNHGVPIQSGLPPERRTLPDIAPELRIAPTRKPLPAVTVFAYVRHNAAPAVVPAPPPEDLDERLLAHVPEARRADARARLAELRAR